MILPYGIDAPPSILKNAGALPATGVPNPTLNEEDVSAGHPVCSNMIG